MSKLDDLKSIIGRYKSAVIAFSGGVDSTFLAKVARDVLGDRLLLVTAYSSTYPARERDEARELAKLLGLNQETIISEETSIEGFADNPPERCYYCKKELFRKLCDVAAHKGYETVFDGSNTDDEHSDYRPGRRALKELHIVSPLLEAGLSKKDIRRYSREMDLPTADKPALACLASRLPYGEKITVEKLDRVARAEEALRDMGFTQLRVRSHGDCARIEFIAQELQRAWTLRNDITAVCKDAGFAFVSIDTQGYRMGAMNEVLDRQS